MVQTIDAPILDAWLKEGNTLLIDVREADEFTAEHIPSAVSLPLSNLPDSMSKLPLPKGIRIVFQCLSGGRSGRACAIYEPILGESHDVYNLTGGIGAWKASQLPVIRALSETGDEAPAIKTTPLSIFRQVQIIVGGMIAACVLLGFFVANLFFVLAGLFAGMLMIAGITGWCGLAMLLHRAPWNKA